MKYSNICVSILMTVGSASHFVVQADNVIARGRGRRTRGPTIESTVRGGQSQQQRGLEPTTCETSEFVCEWEDPSDMTKNKYAICVTEDDGQKVNKCVDSKYAMAGDDVTCGCCEGTNVSGKGFEECSMVLPSTKPETCDTIPCGKGKGSGGYSYCASVKISKGGSPTFGPVDKCGDPFDDIDEEKGEEFIECGACSSEMPSALPSSMPSTSPSSAPSSSPSSAPSLSPSSSPTTLCDLCAAAACPV